MLLDVITSLKVAKCPNHISQTITDAYLRMRLVLSQAGYDVSADIPDAESNYFGYPGMEEYPVIVIAAVTARAFGKVEGKYRDATVDTPKVEITISCELSYLSIKTMASGAKIHDTGHSTGITTLPDVEDNRDDKDLGRDL